MDNVHMFMYEVMEQAVVKPFVNWGSDELLDEKMYKLEEFQDFKKVLVRYLITSWTFTLPVVRCVEQHAEEPLTIQVKFRQENIPEVTAKEYVTPLWQFTGRFHKLSMIPKAMNKRKRLFQSPFGVLICLKSGSSRY